MLRQVIPSPSYLQRCSAARRLLSSNSLARESAKTSGGTSSWFHSNSSLVAVAGVSLMAGYGIGRAQSSRSVDPQSRRVLPDGLPRACCEQQQEEQIHLSEAQEGLRTQLASIVGPENVLDGRSSAQYLKGARLGHGQAMCVVTPEMLEQVVKCVQAIVDADCTVIPQGSNTGLTGGSVPRSTPSSRPVVVINMKKLDTIFPIDGGDRVVCLGGAGLATLSSKIKTWFPGRESHSILGSTFLNPTTAAGISLGSGGTQMRKGSAYTDRAMYITVKRNKWGENVVSVVNTLGVEGLEDGDFPNNSGKAIQQLDAYQQDVRAGYERAMGKSSSSVHGKAKASDVGYAKRLCEENDQVARYNADTRGCDCNRSEGKVLILATVHDTFPRPTQTKTFWISFCDLETTLAFRRQVCLDNDKDLPISLEYMDRDSFDVIDRSGRVVANLIKFVGTESPLVSKLWGVKLWLEGLPIDGAPLFCDRVLYGLNQWFPAVLPSRMMDAGRQLDHHVAMTVGEFGDGSLTRVLDRLQAFASVHGKDKISIHECNSPREAASLTAFRFVAAPAFRTWCVGEGVQGFSVDYALPKNCGRRPTLNSSPTSPKPLKRMRYSHFGCNVFHEDLAYAPNADIHKAKMTLKTNVETQCRGKLPAEHGHGTEYRAPNDTQERWKRMDPLNVMNPGIGALSREYRYNEQES